MTALRHGELGGVRTLREVVRVLREPGLRERVNSALLALPAFATHYRGDTKHVAPRHQTPPGSLGDTLRAFRQHYALTPEFFPIRAAVLVTPLDCAAWLLARDHDVYHVLCEYETSDHDEVSLQSFMCGQSPCVFAQFIARLDAPEKLGRACFKHLCDLLDAEIDREAFARGQRARPLLSIDYDAAWSTPLAAVRATLAIPTRRERPSGQGLRNTCGGVNAPAFFGRD